MKGYQREKEHQAEVLTFHVHVQQYGLWMSCAVLLITSMSEAPKSEVAT